MSEAQIIRPRLAFEREYGQHRNWWVRDSRIAGNPLSILLYLLSHDPSRMPSQTEARKELDLGVSAWQAAKRRLLEAGFLVEIRDRYPRNYVDSSGRPRGGQKRYRLFLQDPEPGYSTPANEALIDLDEPYEEYAETQEEVGCGKSAPVEKTPDRDGCGKSAPQAAENPHPKENPHPFKEEKTGWLVGSISSSNQPTHQTVTAREAEIDAELAGLHPDLRLTMAEIRREVSGRVDLAEIDVVRAVRELVLRTAERGRAVRNPAALVAAVIARDPSSWLLGAAHATGFSPLQEGSPKRSVVNCASGNHWWGPDSWAEIDRANCVDCGLARRTVDSAFAELEAEMLAVRGER
ncbi:hypothetical protein [Leucobacter celer]|uniref:hypothetical protein n=1 Tax=Leucobacter celer TaxID=668625 RepID=UPI000AAF0EC9|nr:hypothetical protein [Leucobacter celer]